MTNLLDLPQDVVRMVLRELEWFGFRHEHDYQVDALAQYGRLSQLSEIWKFECQRKMLHCPFLLGQAQFQRFIKCLDAFEGKMDGQVKELFFSTFQRPGVDDAVASALLKRLVNLTELIVCHRRVPMGVAAIPKKLQYLKIVRSTVHLDSPVLPSFPSVLDLELHYCQVSPPQALLDPISFPKLVSAQIIDVPVPFYRRLLPKLVNLSIGTKDIKTMKQFKSYLSRVRTLDFFGSTTKNIAEVLEWFPAPIHHIRFNYTQDNFTTLLEILTSDDLKSVSELRSITVDSDNRRETDLDLAKFRLGLRGYKNSLGNTVELRRDSRAVEFVDWIKIVDKRDQDQWIGY